MIFETLRRSVEIEICDSTFTSGRVYVLLKKAAKEFPNIPIAKAIEWAEGMDAKGMEQVEKNCESSIKALDKLWDASIKEIRDINKAGE